MIRFELESRLNAAVQKLSLQGFLPSDGLPRVEVTDPRQPDHGDLACSFALAASKAAGKPPRDLAQALVDALEADDLLESSEIAGPGFINFRLKASALSAYVPQIVALGNDLAKTQSPAPNAQRINVEFVSVNPNGPITVGSGRGAAFGSTLCNVLEAAGNDVHREYYINDGVNSEQMRQFADSVRSFVEGLPFPEKGYKGDYVQEVAEQIKASVSADGSNDLDWYQQESQALMLARQKSDLTGFGVLFDTWFSEQSLHDSGQVETDVKDIIAKGAADDEARRTVIKLGKGGKVEDVEWVNQAKEDDEEGPAEGEPTASATPTPSLPRQSEDPAGKTLWLRATKFGDDMDRVLKRKDGRLTYIASDVSYHKDKFNRGNKAGTERATKLITVLGPDHHGYIGRLHAVLAALELETGDERSAISDPLDEFDAKIWSSPEEKAACKAALAKAQKELEVVIFQIVRFVKEGKPAPMRKRDGNIYSLRDLMSEIGKNAAPNAPEEEQMRIGKDVARFFYLMRSHDTHMDFDLDLAEKQSDENPVYYVQYAHARICSVLRKAEESGFDVAGLEAELRTSGNQQSAISNQRLNHPRELALIKKILDLPFEVQRCAEDYGIHRLTTFATELARAYHGFYDACRVIQPEDPELSKARLGLCLATRSGLRAVFSLLGISAPEKMERDSG